jgi:hypothetical protein
MSDQQTEHVEATETEVEPEQHDESSEGSNRQERRDGHVRERLREVEQERDGLRERLDSRDRAEVEAKAKAVLGELGMALFSYTLDDLRDPESGNLDPERVEEALAPVKAALDEGRQVHHGDMGARQTTKGKSASWDQLLQRRT